LNKSAEGFGACSQMGRLSTYPVWPIANLFKQGRRRCLIFMPGGFEIAQPSKPSGIAMNREDLFSCRCMVSCPHRSDAAVARYDKRKVVVATNVAETSLTIDGIRCVIDSGLARIPRYDPYRGINTLFDREDQPGCRGPARRSRWPNRAGVCLRLWSREELGIGLKARIAGGEKAGFAKWCSR